MRRIRFEVVILSVAVGLAAGVACGQGAEDLIAPQDVFVSVRSHNGWGKSSVSTLICDGRFRIVGAYSDTTTIRGIASPDSALSLVNELLAIQFFDQPSKFKSSRTQLMVVGGGKLAELWEKTMDAGASSIELHVGERVHTVVLAYPAYGAPEKLRAWVSRFLSYMKEVRGW